MSSVSAVRPEASLALCLIEWEKLSSFAAVIRHRSACEHEPVTSDPEPHACRLKVDRWVLYICQSPLFIRISLVASVVEHWETGAGFRVAQVMCDDGAELSASASHQIRPDDARLHNEYFTELNHG